METGAPAVRLRRAIGATRRRLEMLTWLKWMGVRTMLFQR